MSAAFDHVVSQGECISSIAATYGFLWQTVWNANPELKKLRKNPNVLFPGDIVKIPERSEKEQDCATEKKHTFVVEGNTTKFRLMVEQYNVAMANRPYILTIDNQLHQGVTDETGLLEVAISPTAQGGRLQLPQDQVDIDLTLGSLNPLEELSGVRQRLHNLGFLATTRGGGESEEELKAAVMYFQAATDLPATGQLDEATRSKLLLMHDQPHPQQKAQPMQTDEDT